MPKGVERFYHLTNKTVSLLVDCRGLQPAIRYFGPLLSDVNERMIEQIDRHEAPASLPSEPAITLSPTHGMGYLGHPALAVKRDLDQWQLDLELVTCEVSKRELRFVSVCQKRSVETTHRLQLAEEAGVLTLTVTLKNLDPATPLGVDNCLITVPVPDHLTEAQEFSGRWGYELQHNRFQLPNSSLVRENRTGRSSHHLHPSLRLLSNSTGLDTGDAVDIQIAWSGNHTIRVERLADGRRLMQAGELLDAGELVLAPGASYTSPECLLCFSKEGTNGLSQQWHRLVRRNYTSATASARQFSPQQAIRPVQLNTWEACYFSVNEANVIELIDQAANLGIERFVLDDGWFHGRNNDQTSLGDWKVDRLKFPRGLGPIAAYCNEKGLEFGLWIEPEMVSPDSNLYRAHPDWVLSFSDSPLIEARHQLVLDLSIEDVTEYLFAVISDLLTDIPISYLKWDMNRDIHQMENAAGQRAVHQQTLALYALMAKVRENFPYIAIESCASGGGRIDLGVLQFANRFWPSDTNDALDRIKVQAGFLSLLPPELMGSHVGPSPCHLTGRQHSMAFRAAVAFWGHMGVEADIRGLTENERSILAAAINLHKAHRHLLHQGRYIEHEPSEQRAAWSIVSDDQTESLTAVALLQTPRAAFPNRIRFGGLNIFSKYRVQLIWPQELTDKQADYRDTLESTMYGGDWLQNVGITLPIMHPESMLIFHLTKS